MMPGVNYIICGCPSARPTPGLSLYRSITMEGNIIAVITQDRVIDGNWKRQIKIPTNLTFSIYY